MSPSDNPVALSHHLKWKQGKRPRIDGLAAQALTRTKRRSNDDGIDSGIEGAGFSVEVDGWQTILAAGGTGPQAGSAGVLQSVVSGVPVCLSLSGAIAQGIRAAESEAGRFVAKRSPADGRILKRVRCNFSGPPR